MFDYLEHHPVAAVVVVVGLVLLMLLDYVVKRRRGTWVPYRRQPVPWSTTSRWLMIAVFVLAAALGGGMAIGAGLAGQAGGVVMGGALAAFSAWLVWLGIVRGRDVGEERQEATAWRRPGLAWWHAAQFAVIPVAVVVGSIGAVWNGHGTWWLLPANVVVITVSALLVRWSLRMRVEDTRSQGRRS